MNQVATFILEDRVFGLNLLQVREVVRLADLTPIPLSRPEIAGLANLRGQIVTLVDLRARLGMPSLDPPLQGHQIILKTRQDLLALQQRGLGSMPQGPPDLMGLMVDAIGDVLEIPEDALEPLPPNLPPVEAAVAQGVTQTSGGLAVLLDLSKLLAS